VAPDRRLRPRAYGGEVRNADRARRPQGIDEADALQGCVLLLRCCQHDDAD